MNEERLREEPMSVIEEAKRIAAAKMLIQKATEQPHEES